MLEMATCYRVNYTCLPPIGCKNPKGSHSKAPPYLHNTVEECQPIQQPLEGSILEAALQEFRGGKGVRAVGTQKTYRQTEDNT